MTFNVRKGNSNLAEEERKSGGERCNDNNEYGDDDRWSFRDTDGYDQRNSGGIGRYRKPDVYPPYRPRGRNLRSTMTFNGSGKKSTMTFNGFNDSSRAAGDAMRCPRKKCSEGEFHDNRSYADDERWSSLATDDSNERSSEDIRPRQKLDVFQDNREYEEDKKNDKLLWRDNPEYEEDKRDEREHEQRSQPASSNGDRSCVSGKYDSERSCESQARCVSSEQYFFVHRGNGGEQIGCSPFPQVLESLGNETAEETSREENEYRQLEEEPQERRGADSPELELISSSSDDSESAYELASTSEEESDDEIAEPALGYAPEVRHCRAFAALLELKKKKKLMRIVKEQNPKLIYTVEMLSKFMTVYK